MKWLVSIVFILALPPASLAAEPVCADAVCVDTVEVQNGVELFATNHNQALPISFNIKLSLMNMEIAEGSDAPIVLQGNERRKLLVLRPRSPGAWSWRYDFGWSRGDFTAQHDDSHTYRLPFETGEAFRIMQSCNGTFSHVGNDRYAIDFGTPEGTVITAARGGRVVDVIQNNKQGGPSERFRALDNRIVILHGDRTHAIYSHLQFGGALVQIGQSVEEGQPIGLSGNTGFSTAPHLHFAVAKGMADVNAEMTIPITFATANGPVTCPPEASLPRQP